MFTIARDCAEFCSRVAHPYHVFTTFRLWSLLVATLLEFLYLAEKLGGSVCESNAPATGDPPPTGFEDRGNHRTACASMFIINCLQNTFSYYCITTGGIVVSG